MVLNGFQESDSLQQVKGFTTQKNLLGLLLFGGERIIECTAELNHQKLCFSSTKLHDFLRKRLVQGMI